MWFNKVFKKSDPLAPTYTSPRVLLPFLSLEKLSKTKLKVLFNEASQQYQCIKKKKIHLLHSSVSMKNGDKTQCSFLPITKVFCSITDSLDDAVSPGVFSSSSAVQCPTSQRSSFQTTSLKLCSFSSASKERVTQDTDAPEYI